MQVGYYSGAFGVQDFHHSFAIVDGNINFQCYGGIYGDEKSVRVFPADFWTPVVLFSKNLGKALFCNNSAPRALAEFQIPTDFTRTNYDRKSGGYLNLGDCSGQVYGVTGVCHQMCNIITIAMDVQSLLLAPVNWPPSLSLSMWVYSFRGNAISPLIAIIQRLLGILSESKENDFPASDNALNDLYDAYHKELREQLEKGHLPEERTKYLENLITEITSPNALDLQNLMPSISEADAKFQKVKNDLDNLLIRGQVGYSEFADTVNKALADMVNRCAEILSPADFEKIFKHKPGEKPFSLIDPNLMPDTYKGVKKALGL